MATKRAGLVISPKDIDVASDAEGIVASFPITSAEHGTEGTFTFSLTTDMRLSLRWDGVGLADFQAWSTQ